MGREDTTVSDGAGRGARDRVLEVKRRLDRSVRTYQCEAVQADREHAVLLYRLSRQRKVADLVLPAGTLTLAYYWKDRPYNVYHWIAPSGETLAYYFNLSGPVTIGRDRLEWEDLEVDVLVTPDGRVRILDEDAVPESAAARLPEIARARERVLADWPDVSREIERASRAFQAASGTARA